MPEYSNNTSARILKYLETHGPSPSLEIERALRISQSAVSIVLRSETDLTKTERQPHLIYSKALTKQKPVNIRATIADNLRIAQDFYRKLSLLGPEDELELEELARLFITKSVRVTAHLEKLIKDNEDDDES